MDSVGNGKGALLIGAIYYFEHDDDYLSFRRSCLSWEGSFDRELVPGPCGLSIRGLIMEAN